MSFNNESHLKFKLLSEISEGDYTAWQQLWKESPHAHFFNSVYWFKSCDGTFSYKEKRLIKIFDKDRLVLVLPLVKQKRYGLEFWCEPFFKGADRSSLLVLEFNEQIFQKLQSIFQTLGNVALSEVSIDVVSFLSERNFILEQSHSPLINLNEPFSGLSKKTRKKIRSNVNNVGKRFPLVIMNKLTLHELGQIRLIEERSHKPTDFMDIFSNDSMVLLYKKLIAECSDLFLIGYLLDQGKPVICDVSIVAKQTVHSLYTAYYESHRKFGLGKLLQYQLLEYLSSKGFTELDLGRGVNLLKQQFSTNVRTQYSVFFMRNIFMAFYVRILGNLEIVVNDIVFGSSILFRFLVFSKKARAMFVKLCF